MHVVDSSHQNNHMHRQLENSTSPMAATHFTKSPRSSTEQQQIMGTHSFSSGNRHKRQTGSINSLDSLCSSFLYESKLPKRPPVHHTHSQQNSLGGSNGHHQLSSPRCSSEISGKQAMHEFAHRLETARDLLYKGVPVMVWDRYRYKQELIVKLSNELAMDNEVPQLQFTTSRSYLVWRQPCRPFDLDCKTQIQMGVRRGQGEGIDPDDELSVTLFCVSENFGGSERSVVMRCSEERTCRDLFSAIRTILTEAALRASGVSTVDDTVALASSNVTAASDSDSTLKPPDQSNVNPYSESISQLESELAEERKKCQQIMLQMMEAANNGNNKEVEINVLRAELRSLEDDVIDMKQVNSTHMNMYSKALKRMEAYQFECEELQLENAILHEKAAML